MSFNLETFKPLYKQCANKEWLRGVHERSIERLEREITEKQAELEERKKALAWMKENV